MDLIAIAVPFFLIALLLELALDRLRGTGYFRAVDAINSLSAGTLSTTFGYFTRIVPTVIWAYAFENFAIVHMSLEWFDLSISGLALWCIAMIGWDFCYYWAHRGGHEISILWAAHAVHHQSEDYNLSTALRQTSSGFVFSWVFYLPMFIIGFPPQVLITVNALNLIYQFWVHTRFIGKLGWIDRVFVTPSNHRVHHAQNPLYIDRNYGGILVLWDRLFGTFQEELDEEPVVFGVRKPLASWNPFWANIQVYAYLWFDARRTRRWRDKIGIWFRRTGWRPRDVDARYPRAAANIEDFKKFEPAVTAPMHRYIVGQFLVAVLGVLWIGERYSEMGFAAVTIPCLSLWIQLYTLGLLSESLRYAIRFEFARLIVIQPAAALAFTMTSATAGDDLQIWLSVLLYSAVSCLALAWVSRSGMRYATSAGPVESVEP